jgi:hypothetical protein
MLLSPFQIKHSFSLSYGVILPSSFTVVLSMPLCTYILPPVSVSCTVFFRLSLSGATFSLRLHLSRHLAYYPCFRLPPSTLFLSLPSYTHLFSPFSYWLGTALPNSHHSSYVGTFGASATGFLPHFFVTHVNILTPDRTPLQISPIFLYAIQDTLLPYRVLAFTTTPATDASVTIFASSIFGPIGLNTVRCYAFIIRLAAPRPTACMSLTSQFLFHSDRVWDLIALSGLSPS